MFLPDELLEVTLTGLNRGSSIGLALRVGRQINISVVPDIIYDVKVVGKDSGSVNYSIMSLCKTDKTMLNLRIAIDRTHTTRLNIIEVRSLGESTIHTLNLTMKGE